MAKFMFLQRGNCEDRPKMSPEQMEAGMKAWMDWIKKGTDEGELVGGYTIVEAPDLAAACDLAKQTIQLAGGGKIEVREFANVGQ